MGKLYKARLAFLIILTNIDTKANQSKSDGIKVIELEKDATQIKSRDIAQLYGQEHQYKIKHYATDLKNIGDELLEDSRCPVKEKEEKGEASGIY